MKQISIPACEVKPGISAFRLGGTWFTAQTINDFEIVDEPIPIDGDSELAHRLEKEVNEL